MSLREIFFANSGTPATGLTLTWESLKKVSDTTDFTPQPTFTEIGGGWYKFDINPTEKLVGVIDGSSTLVNASERYQPVYFDIYDFLYEIFVQPVYDEDTDSLTFLTFMLKNGKITTNTLCEITVYDATHVEQFALSSSTSTNGVFVLTKSTPSLVKNRSYYAIVEITEDGIVHTSADTYISLE